MASAHASSDAAQAEESWFPAWLGPPVLAVVFAALTRWSWRRWPDVFLDFGSQLYIPWQLSVGRNLYVDIDYKDGPLSQYANAFLFATFGVALDTIVWANLILLVVLCILVYALLARAFGHFTATLAVLVQLMVFSFSQYTRVANYNYVTPYAQEQTHGLLLAIVMIFFLDLCARKGRGRDAALAGVALGLTSLTKAELAMPALAAALLGLGLVALMRPRAGASLRALVAVFAAGAVAPVVVCVVLLARRMPLATALRGAAGNWIHLRGDILDYKFYRVGMGLDDPWGNFVLMLTVFAVLAAIVAFAVAVAWATRGMRRGRVPTALVAGVVFGVGLWASSATIRWAQVGRALPITAALALLGFTGAVVAYRRDRARAVPFIAPAILALFALGLLGKVVLAVRISHYGFVLALPATLLLIASLVHVIPNALATRGFNATMGRALLVAPVLAAACFFLGWGNRVYGFKNTLVGSGADAIVTSDEGFDPRGPVLFQAAERMQALMPPDATLMVVPDGLMLNYWLRRRNPTRHIYFVPWSLAFANGEAAVLDEIRQHPPDFVAITDRKATEYGFEQFGAEGFGALIMQWVRANYRRVERIGFEPMTDRGFGVLLMAYDPGK